MTKPTTTSSVRSAHACAAFARLSRLRAMLFATTALAALPLTAARAADATWLANPASGDFNNGSNWSGGATPDGTATFGASSNRNIGFSRGSTFVGGISVTDGNYVFTNGKLSLTLTGAGFSVARGASLVFNNSFLLSFTGASSAGGASIGNAKDSILVFRDTSNAGSAAISGVAGARLLFQDSSSAGQSSIFNLGSLVFSAGSTADRAVIGNFGVVAFQGSSSADRATITNDLGADLAFNDSSTAKNATIVNHGDLGFSDASTAGSATVTSDRFTFFQGNASGGTARLVMTNGLTTFLDISGLTTGGMTIGSIEGDGGVFLGSKNLAVGGNNLSTTFAGFFGDGGAIKSGGTGGSLTKEGTGAFTLTGVSSYTGQTRIEGGMLVVDGSIAASSNVRVDAGGTLAGTGTVSSTNVFDGGTLVAGHGEAPFGALKVRGDLGFARGATYFVQVSPDAAGATSVTGTATLGGATVAASFAKGSYVTKQYSILDANSISGSFGQLVPTNLLPVFTAALSYDPKHVFLKLSANPDPSSIVKANGGNAGEGDPLQGFKVNQRKVMAGFANSFNTTGSISATFATQSAAGLTQVSGETAVGSQQATFDAMGQFMGVMLDPTLGGRSASGAPREAMASMPRKAPVAEDFSSRWAVWAAGFGGSQSVNGDAVLGSNKTTSGVFGSAVGADYRISPNTVVGFALAGGGTHFNVANGGSGNSDLFQAGTYLRHTQGAAFIAAALAYGWQDVTTNRTVTAAGFDSLRGRFNANALSGRLEGGYRVAGAIMDVTPYAAGQFISYHLPSYAEQVASGANTFVLAYSGKDVTASRTELGVRTERVFAQDNASLLTLRGRLAWAHDFNTDRNLQAVFVTLPGSAFTVNGAQASANTALTSLSAEIAWRSGWAVSATFDGQFSDTTKSYAGKGVVRYAW